MLIKSNNASTMHKFRNADGTLNRYALACGYQECYTSGVRLFLDGVYHVKGNGIWETFDTVSKARAFVRDYERKTNTTHFRGVM